MHWHGVLKNTTTIRNVLKMPIKEINSNAEELEKFAELEGTELGEMCTLLVRLHGYRDYIGAETVAALSAEIEEQLQYFKETFRIAETEVTITRTVIELVELDD